MGENLKSILQNLPPRISDVVRLWATRSPKHPAIVDKSDIWTYAQFESAIAQTRTWLCTLEVRPGDRVMIVGENCKAFITLFMATADLNAWPVLVSARLSATEVDKIQDHCGARRVIYTVSASTASLDHAKRNGANIEEVPNLGTLGISAVDQEVQPEQVGDDAANEVAAVIYTSGTTGTPKGVMLTHGNLLFIAAVSANIRSLTPKDRIYGILPMSHAVGLSVVLLGSLLSGATLYLCPRFDPMTARRMIERDCLTVVLGVPSMFAQFLQYAKLRGLTSLRVPSLRIISSSGAPLDLTTKRATEQLFGLSLHNGYGITECSPTIAQTRVEAQRSDTSVGPLLPGVEAKFIGPNGDEVPIGEVGELRVRGPNIMKGYYRDPDATAASVDAEGWFNTRDLAKLEGGSLFIVGRTKELIVHSGFNVYPAEVEAVLNAHPAVVHSAVLGISIAGDEEVIAFVQPLPDSALTAVDLEEYASRHLAPYKRPSKILLMSSLPKTATGKIAKNELKRTMEGDISLTRGMRWVDS